MKNWRQDILQSWSKSRVGQLLPSPSIRG
ncbi:hypothetical protein MC885_021311 [Smutsia gigantea]|nr:hypothetical protein MC885_021311 [Smutsia gigantea]